MLENWKSFHISGKMRYYTHNASGRFDCDEQGKLTSFEAAEKNRLHQAPFGYGGCGMINSMQTLTIPEGIRSIGMDKGELWDLIIVEKLVFPTTLEKLESGALSRCLIMEMELPASLCEIGPGALMCDYIHVLRIPQGMKHPKYPVWGQKKVEGVLTVHGRQFKETIINTLIVPKEYPYKELMLETKINNIVYSD